MARKVVGVGSVGTLAWVFLLVGREGKDPLVLQAKEAQASVLEAYLGASEFDSHGERVVRGQRMSQAASDIFLSWQRSEDLAGKEHDFYVRQLWDWKASADPSTMSEAGLHAYTRACGWALARAHARSGDRLAIAAYLGAGSSFDRAIARFSSSYADQNERDHKRLADAVAASAIGDSVLVVGHPFIDVWQAVKPGRVGLDAWPDIPRSIEWKHGICEALGWPPARCASCSASRRETIWGWRASS